MDAVTMEQSQNEKTDIFANGSVWLRADFHLHTRKDKEFAQRDNNNNFVKRFIDRLVAEEIGIGVITNHNKFDKGEYKDLQKKAKQKNIMILAGTELSVNDGANGIHCLIVFDETTWLFNKSDEDYINQFLTAAFEGIPNRENENTRCNYNLTDLLNKLDGHRKQGRDSFVILAHVEQKSGFFNELKGGRIEQLACSDLFKSFVLGFQKMRSYDKVGAYRKWFGGALPAFVEGSDCKSIEEVGKTSTQKDDEKKTYIKIGNFNFEALKYALTDKEHRVCDKKPALVRSYIKSIQFEGGKLNGKYIGFSPELNNLIGIRGSGKSAILEILRYALGIQLTHSSADKSYKDELITYVLGSGGKVVIHIINEQRQEFRIEKIYGQKENIFRNDTDELCACSISAVFQLPVYFGQKDLSHKKDDFESDLLKRLIGDKLQNIGREIDTKKREIANIILELQKSSNLDGLKDEANKIIKDATQKLLYFKENGIEEKLKLQTQFEQDNNTLISCKNNLGAYISAIEELAKNYDALFTSPLNASAEINKPLFEEVNNIFTNVKKDFDKLKELNERNRLALQKFDTMMKLFEVKQTEMSEEFAQVKREINSDSLNPDTFLALNRLITTSKIKLQEISKQEEKQHTLKSHLLTALNELNELWLKEFNILNDEKNKIHERETNLNIEITFKGAKQQFLDKIKEIFRGTGIRETAYQTISEEFADFIELYRDTDKLLGILGNNNKAAFDKRFIENLKELLTFRVEDKVNINYKGKPLNNHSLGQRASALILFLLAQKDNDILIIDQPEDDLDNQTIYDEVIKEILRLKDSMQFIFATHNANIPVLGDSEKILSCSFEDSAAITLNAGTIDTPSIQKSIVDIMEGGKEAFNKRKYIYDIWK